MKTKYDISDLWWQDRFEMSEDCVYWYYYNEDGNDGAGQVVEICIRPYNIMLDAKTEDEFWDHLYEDCTTYLHDNSDTDYQCYIELLLEKRDDSEEYRNSCSSDTMNWLIKWAERKI